MKTFLLAALTLSLFMLNACGNSSPKQESSTTLAHRLLDDGRAEEAIFLLENSPESEKQARDHKITLASAYAYLSGVQLRNFAGTIHLVGKQISERPEQPFAQKNAPPDSEARRAYLQLENMISEVSYFNSFLKSIPMVTPENMEYLEEALGIIKTLEPLRPEESAFRTLLTLAEIKYYFSSKLFDNALNESKRGENCEVDVNIVQLAALDLNSLFQRVLKDILQMRPSQKEKLEKMSEKLGEDMQKLAASMGALLLLDESAKILAKARLEETGMFKAIKCSEPKLQ